MVDDPRPLSRRLGAFLQRRSESAKQLALRLECDHRTAENIRAGRGWPIERHWLSIWAEFGDDVLEAVFYPEKAELRLKQEARQREEARQRRLASIALERPYFGAQAGLGEALAADDEPLEPGSPNLDLFEDLQFSPSERVRP